MSQQRHSVLSSGCSACYDLVSMRQPAAPSARSQHGGLSLFRLSVAALPVLVGVVVYLWYNGVGYNARGFPESYALCTYGAAIYTVHAAKPRVDCILVERDKIAATGSIRASSTCVILVIFCKPRVSTDEVKAHWDEVQDRRHGIQDGIAKHRDDLKVLHVAKGMIVVPGLAGMSF